MGRGLVWGLILCAIDQRSCRCSCGFCGLSYFNRMATEERIRLAIQAASAWIDRRRIIGFLLGLAFILVTNETVRWMHGGAFAQSQSQAVTPTPQSQNATSNTNSPTVQNNGGIVTFGQSGNNTLVTGPRYKVIGPETIKYIRDHIPEGSKIDVDTAINDAPTQEIALQLFNLLKELGYKIDPEAIGPGAAMGVPYFKGFQISGSEGRYSILVGDPRQD